MKNLLVAFAILGAVQAASARTTVSIEDYYEMSGYANFTSEQKVIADQNIKLVHLLDAILPEDPGANMEHVYGVSPEGESCQLSRNRSNMFLSPSNVVGETRYHFSWDPIEMGDNLKGNPIVGAFRTTSTTVEATAKVPWYSGSLLTVSKVGLKLELLSDKRVSISIRDYTTALRDKYITCIFKK